MLDQKKTENTSDIQCKIVTCDSQGWDSYVINGKIVIECSTCGQDIEGDFVTDENGWTVRKQVTRTPWSNTAFAGLCQMYESGAITLTEFLALIERGSC